MVFWVAAVARRKMMRAVRETKVVVARRKVSQRRISQGEMSRTEEGWGREKIEGRGESVEG